MLGVRHGRRTYAQHYPLQLSDALLTLALHLGAQRYVTLMLRLVLLNRCLQVCRDILLRQEAEERDVCALWCIEPHLEVCHVSRKALTLLLQQLGAV